MSEYLVDGPVNPELITRLFSNDEENNDSGGISVFIGRVRADIKDNRKVVAIDYSAYDKMVNSVADRIKSDIRLEFSEVRSVKILHSTGIVNAGEISLFIMVEACHRRQAIDACSMTVELIKEKLPVWKRELLDNDSYEWKTQ
jgi:molybdopterin synthase catalytic subunit